METSQPLATESFSYSWLINKKPSFDGLNEPFRISLDNSDEATSEQRKSKMVTSKGFLVEAQNFNFDIPISESPAAFVHADEIFSDGHIIPIYVDPSKIEAFNSSNSVPAIPVSALSSKTVCPANKSHCHFLRKWRKSSKRVLQNYFGLLKPLCRKVGCSRRSIKVDDIDRKVWEVKSWSNSPVASPRQSTAYSTSDCCGIKRNGTKIADTDMVFQNGKSWSSSPLASPQRSPSYSTGDWCDIESSIYEAILHCKRSIEK
uniref:Putative membrane-associated kinase regulator 6 n=1 Tax=Davidia involucrata TaxID=16924 RepID=A0A5B7B684_DAVIN